MPKLDIEILESVIGIREGRADASMPLRNVLSTLRIAINVHGEKITIAQVCDDLGDLAERAMEIRKLLELEYAQRKPG